MFNKKWPSPKSVLNYLTLSHNIKNKYINKQNETISSADKTNSRNYQ